MTFAIYKQQEGGAPIWLEMQNVAVDDSGRFTASLGSTKSEGIPIDLFSAQEERWLAVKVEGQPEQSRVLLVSVPYAFKAQEAETLGGLPASAFVKLDAQQPSGNSAGQSLNGLAAPQASNSNDNRGQVGGHGTKGYLSVWQTPLILGNSFVFQTDTGKVGIGTTTPAATLDVNGNVNNAGTYQIAGSTVLGLSSAGHDVFLGVGAGFSNTGQDNTFSGYQAGYSNTYGSRNTFYGHQVGYNNTSGVWNTFSGYQSGYNNTSGVWNTFSGYQSGYNNTSGSSNTFTGMLSGVSNTTGGLNTFTGQEAGDGNTVGGENSFYGFEAGLKSTSGNANTFSGAGAGYFATTGSHNTFVGWHAGYYSYDGSYNTYLGDNAGGAGSGNTSLGYSAGSGGHDSIQIGEYSGTNTLGGANNIYVGNKGPCPPCYESNTIRIGGDIGLGSQTAAYIAGIYGSAVGGSGIAVYVDSNGQLGTTVSSRRFKEQIRDMGDSTNALMKLRPVTFLYKTEYDKGQRTLQYGLIAEEVAEVYPNLVAYDPEGNPYTVKYQYLTTMLLNELQKEHRKVEELKAELAVQNAELKKQNEQLEQRLMRVETLLQSKMNSVIAQTASAVSLQPEGTRK